MMTSADKVGGWVKKGQNHDDVKINNLNYQARKIIRCQELVKTPVIFYDMKN